MFYIERNHRRDIPWSELAVVFGITAPILEIILWFSSKQSCLNRILQPLTFYAYALFLGALLCTDAITFGLGLRKRAKFLTTALFDALAIFVTFSIFAIISSNRVVVYCSSLVLVSLIVIINLIAFEILVFELIIGIVLGCLYIIIDTQNIIYRCEIYDYYVFRDAKLLFIDFAEILVKLYFTLRGKDKVEIEKKDK